MKIGFDGKRATNNLTGLGNYSRSLISNLITFFPQNQYFVYSEKVKNIPQINDFLKSKSISLKKPLSKHLFWRSYGIKKNIVGDDIDLFHGLSHELPLGINKLNIPSVVTVHDLIFIKFPQYFKPIDRFIYRLKCEYACKHATKIIAISERTKLDLIEIFNIDSKKIEVVYQSCDDAFKIPVSPEKKQTVAAKHNLPEHYVLSVGTIETRKNLLTIIKALPKVNDHYKLVVVGKKTKYFQLVIEEIKALNLDNKVIFLDNVPFDDLPAIYQMATVFVYPSIYEGFGIPIIEALYSGVPVVAATGSCLEEAGGDHSLYVSPFDSEAFSKAINLLIDDGDFRKEVTSNGLSFVEKFETRSIANDLMKVYKDLVPSKL